MSLSGACHEVAGYEQSTKLSNCKFHESVRHAAASRTLCVQPPEGEVRQKQLYFITVFNRMTLC